MVSEGKKLILLLVSMFVILISLNSVSAFGVASTLNSSQYINRSMVMPISINMSSGSDGLGEGNITQINITLPTSFTFQLHSNISSDDNYSFSNSTTSSYTVLTWKNTTVATNTTDITITFNVTASTAGRFNLNLSVINQTLDQPNSSLQAIIVNFAFSGYVKNESGDVINATNVTMYRFKEAASGPPAEVYESSILSSATGLFHFPSINGSEQSYKIKLIYKANGTDYGVVTNGNASKTGTILPPFPSSLFYPLSTATSSDFSLNGSSFYLQDAATLNITAKGNASGNHVYFGYEVIDQKVGFPIESNINTNLSYVEVVVPTGKDYTVIAMRTPDKFPFFGNTDICNGTFINETNCPSPPKSNSSLGTLVAGRKYDVIINLTVTKIYMHGCINIDPNHWDNSSSLNSTINVTNLAAKLQPWQGVVMMETVDDGLINITDSNQLNTTSAYIDTTPICTKPWDIGYYNITLNANTNYMIEIYAKNASNEASQASQAVAGEYLAGFYNLTTPGSDVNQTNISLYRLLGNYVNDGNGTGYTNTSLMKINIQNKSGSAVTENLHVEVKVKESVIGETSYIIDSNYINNGTFYLPILNTSSWARVYVFANNAPPIAKTLNLSVTENNVTMISVDPATGGDKGLRRMNSTGDLETYDSSAVPFEINFLSKGTSNQITNMSASSFNPLKALVAGEVDLEIRDPETGVVVKFNDFDMFSAKQPPMFAVIDNNTLVSSTAQTWNFGNFVPRDVYGNVTITIPYRSASVDEDYTYYIRIPVLYEESPGRPHEFMVAWNYSAGHRDYNLSDEFSEYNQSFYRDYLSSTGMLCSKTNSSKACYMDLNAETFVLTIPHFSGVSPSLVGSAPSTTTTSSTSSGGSAAKTWSKTYTISDSEFATGVIKELKTNERVKFEINGDTHYVGVESLTDTTAKISVSSIKQEATLSIGEEKRFDVTDDGYYDVYVRLISIANNKASINIKSIFEEVVAEEEKTPTEKIKEAIEEGIEAVKSPIGLIIAGVIIVVVIFLILYIVLRRRKQTK